MGEVKRYDPMGYDKRSGYMQQHQDGDYVHHDDYATLEAERDTLRQQLAVAEETLERWLDLDKRRDAERDTLRQQRDKLAGLLREKFPRIDPENPYPLNEVEHHCEYMLYQERERLHGEIDAALAEVNK